MKIRPFIKEELITAIKEYIGKDGCIAFEHGYLPYINAAMITDKEIHLRVKVGKNRISKIPLEKLNEDQLKNIIVELVKYENYCRIHA